MSKIGCHLIRRYYTHGLLPSFPRVEKPIDTKGLIECTDHGGTHRKETIANAVADLFEVVVNGLAETLVVAHLPKKLSGVYHHDGVPCYNRLASPIK